MTKEMTISDDAAFLFERVRKVLNAGEAEHQDNSAVIICLCAKFLHEAGVEY